MVSKITDGENVTEQTKIVILPLKQTNKKPQTYLALPGTARHCDFKDK